MMLKFNRDAITFGDVIGRGAYGIFGKTIRAIIGSYTNHNAIFVRATQEALDMLGAKGLLDKDYPIRPGEWCIAEAIWPRSTLTSLAKYELMMNNPEEGQQYPVQVEVWRVPLNKVSQQEREAVCERVLSCQLDVKYPLNVVRLWIMRFVNNLPWKIHGEWCTKLVWESWESIVPGIFNRPPDGKRKKNPTPRTYENRLAAGVIVPVTSSVVVSTEG